MVVRLKDVAERAGVSTQLASHVLNGTNTTSGASEATRQRVLKVADELNYVRNAAAASLKQGRSMTIGLMSHWLPEVPHSRAMVVAEDLCSANGYSLQVSRTNHSPQWVNLLRSGRVDLLITTGSGELGLAGLSIPPALRPKIALVGATPVPLHVRRQWGYQIGWEDAAIGRMAAEYLYRKGCRRIVMLTMTPGATARAPQFNARSRELGMESKIVIGPPELDRPRQGYAMMWEVLKEFPGCDGLCFYSDDIHPGVMAALREANLTPEHYPAMIGFGANYSPFLTSIRPPLEEGFRMVLEAFFADTLSELRDTTLEPVLELSDADRVEFMNDD